MLTDLDFFEQEILRFNESVAETLMKKRSDAGLMNDDPMDELTEIYSEVGIIENDFKKALGICRHLLGHSRDLFNHNREMN
jgi:hypothetical protein